MNKIFLTLLVGMFLISLTSAAEFDNKLTYSNEDLKVELKNWFGLGKDYGSLELKSHQSVDEVLQVPYGDSVVMYYDFDFKDVYENGLGEVEFTDMKTGNQVEREYKFVYWQELVEMKPHWVQDCKNKYVIDNQSTYCSWILEGESPQTKGSWKDYNSKDIPEGKIRIGLMAKVELLDTIDGVWTIGGKQVSKHAVWTASLNANIVSYWKLNESETAGYLDSLGRNNITANTCLNNATGIIANGSQCNGVNNHLWVNTTHFPVVAGTSFTMNGWVKINTTGNNIHLWGFQNDADGSRIQAWIDGSQWFFRSDTFTGADLSSGVAAATGTWTMFTIRYNHSATNLSIWLNGTYRISESSTYNANAGIWWAVGTNPANSFDSNGTFDEIGVWNRTLTDQEVLDLWNGGAGISYSNPVLTVVSTSPANAALFQTNAVNFSTNVSDSEASGVKNVSLLINGTINATNTSFLQGAYNFNSSIIPEGFWTYSFEVYDNSSSRYTSSNGSLNFTVDTQFPQVSSNSSTTYTFQQINTALPLYYTITDANRDSCFIQWYNGTNASITCATGSVSVNTTGFYTPRNLTFWGNDTAGHYNSTFINWSYKLFLENETYAPHVLEGSTNNFTLQVLTNGSTISLANLSYNNMENLGSLSSGTNYTIYDTVAAPLVTSDTNYTFFWNISFADGTYYALNSRQQNVTNLGIGNCSYFTNVIYNFTLKDEETQVELNESALSNIGGFVDIDLRVFGDDDVVSNFSQTYNNTNPFGVCTNSTFSGGQQYNIDAQVQYFATGYSTELYHIQNATLNSTTLNQNITLYDLLTASTQIFDIIFKSSSFLPVEDY